MTLNEWFHFLFIKLFIVNHNLPHLGLGNKSELFSRQAVCVEILQTAQMKQKGDFQGFFARWFYSRTAFFLCLGWKNPTGSSFWNKFSNSDCKILGNKFYGQLQRYSSSVLDFAAVSKRRVLRQLFNASSNNWTWYWNFGQEGRKSLNSWSSVHD